MKSSLPFLFAVAAIGAIAWNGCGPGTTRYSCDATGCYECDGYGCTSVTPPKPGACTGSKSCGAGQICDSTLCRTGCRRDPDCPMNQYCDAGTLTCKPGCTADAITSIRIDLDSAAVAGWRAAPSASAAT